MYNVDMQIADLLFCLLCFQTIRSWVKQQVAPRGRVPTSRKDTTDLVQMYNNGWVVASSFIVQWQRDKVATINVRIINSGDHKSM